MRSAYLAIALLLVLIAPTALAEPAVWSWEQVLEPLDILTFVEDLPYDEWIEIDEVTCRRLFEDVIQRSLEQMEIDGGHFEQMLRERFFYFTPEREYYYPPYEEDFSQREVLFPVTVMREQNSHYDAVIELRLGRFSDDMRELAIVFQYGGLYVIEQNRYLYYPAETGPKKTRELATDYYDERVLVTKSWFDDGGSLFTGSHRLFEYEVRNSTPVVDNTAEERPLELMGIDILFDLPHQNWSAYGSSLFQTYSGLVHLLELQLGISASPHELHRFLWPELFYYDNADSFGVNIELCNAKRLYTFDTSREQFLFNGGNVHTLRTLDLTLSIDLAPTGYEWGIESIVLTRNILVRDDEVGQEKKDLTIRETSSGVVLECWVSQTNAAGEEIARWQIARFEEGNPNNLALP
jgi:hypothetical protein